MSTNILSTEQQQTLDHIRELLTAHVREGEDAADDEGKFGIGFHVTNLRHSAC
jgi:hypothetical protein